MSSQSLRVRTQSIREFDTGHVLPQRLTRPRLFGSFEDKLVLGTSSVKEGSRDSPGDYIIFKVDPENRTTDIVTRIDSNSSVLHPRIDVAEINDGSLYLVKSSDLTRIDLTTREASEYKFPLAVVRALAFSSDKVFFSGQTGYGFTAKDFSESSVVRTNHVVSGLESNGNLYAFLASNGSDDVAGFPADNVDMCLELDEVSLEKKRSKRIMPWGITLTALASNMIYFGIDDQFNHTPGGEGTVGVFDTTDLTYITSDVQSGGTTSLVAKNHVAYAGFRSGVVGRITQKAEVQKLTQASAPIADLAVLENNLYACTERGEILEFKD